MAVLKRRGNWYVWMRANPRFHNPEEEWGMTPEGKYNENCEHTCKNPPAGYEYRREW